MVHPSYRLVYNHSHSKYVNISTINQSDIGVIQFLCAHKYLAMNRTLGQHLVSIPFKISIMNHDYMITSLNWMMAKIFRKTLYFYGKNHGFRLRFSLKPTVYDYCNHCEAISMAIGTGAPSTRSVAVLRCPEWLRTHAAAAPG